MYINYKYTLKIAIFLEERTIFWNGICFPWDLMMAHESRVSSIINFHLRRLTSAIAEFKKWLIKVANEAIWMKWRGFCSNGKNVSKVDLWD